MEDTPKDGYYFKCLDFPGHWRIIWFGRLSRLSESSDSVSIYVYLGKLTGVEKYEYALPLEYKRVNLPISHFPVLYIGAVLKDGSLIPPEKLPSHFHHIQDIKLDLTKDNISAFSRTGHDDSGHFVPRTKQWEFFQEPQADSYLLGINHNDNPYGIIIPCAEVLRFFYCYSSNIAKVMTSDRILNPGRWLYNLKESGFNEQTGIVTMKPRLAVSELTRVFLACFISGRFDINQAKRIPKQVAVISRTAPERPFVAFPPFDGPCTINASYHTYDNHRCKQTIVTRIFSIDLPLNFNAIITPYNGVEDGGKGQRRPPSWTKIIVKNPSEQTVKLNPGAINPALGTEINFNDELGQRFPTFLEVVQIPTKRKGEKECSEPAISTTTHPEGSTSDKESSDSKFHKTIILPGGTKTDLGDIGETAFSRIQSALKLIKSAVLAEVTFLSLTDEVQKSDDSNDCVVYNLPKRDHEEPWAYLNKFKEQRRRFIIAEVSKNQDTRYLVEFEQKSSGECSTLVIWNSDSEVPGEDILAAIEECIINNACYLQSRSFAHSWSKLRHSWKKNEHLKPDHFLDRIFSAESLLKGI